MKKNSQQSWYSAEVTARELREALADRGLTPAFARLYSQHTKLNTVQSGLDSWTKEESILRLHDAMRLAASGLLEKELNAEGWQNSLRRAGELLEWLAHPDLNPENLPLVLFASAVYQLAGYPARSTGLLNQAILGDEQSRILYHFLKADFPSLFEELAHYWTTEDLASAPTNIPWHSEVDLSIAIHSWLTRETASALGVLCGYMRWGDDRRIVNAISKLEAIADVLLHGTDPYSWLLAKLCAEVASKYVNTSLRQNLSVLNTIVGEQGEIALEFYLRQSYLSCKSLTWPSQSKGIERLNSSGSFTLCTPTGSGKTTIAEIAILQSLFTKGSTTDDVAESPDIGQPMALYLVPSRALATEVESKLARVVGQISNERVVVTGLYGGTDWGPTDAWLTASDKTILICTYEKAEALLRFLGSLFLNRVSLIVLDEAHKVLFDGDFYKLQRGESRPLRLEALCARLLTFLQDQDSRIIALSAVAGNAENILSHWIANSTTSIPVTTAYRSTRQLIGYLECSQNGYTEISYNLLDSANLQFKEKGRSDTPYIPNPFPQCPILGKWQKEKGVEKKNRPHLFWAAMHLTQPGSGEQPHSVLISISQNIDGFAEDFLDLLNGVWSTVDRPQFFRIPKDPVKMSLWQQALLSCEDYFGKKSNEYQLLEKGVVVHHGKMPGLLARLLVQLIDEQIIGLVLATSTLSEGINLPFETVLIPSLLRRGKPIKTDEFANLVGRAGRPGFGTEGRSLVVLSKQQDGDKVANNQKLYRRLIKEMQLRNPTMEMATGTAIQSPLAALLMRLEEQWRRIENSDSHEAFMVWLERTTPIDEQSTKLKNIQDDSAAQMLDSLDAVLLAAVVELEQVAKEELSLDSLEEKLQKIWRRSYAYYASQQELELQRLFVLRGLALKQKIYPEKNQRRRLYRTGLPPISGTQLLLVYSNVLDHLKLGWEYSAWSTAQKLAYIEEIVYQVRNVPQFRQTEEVDNYSNDWRKVLYWWLDPRGAIDQPTNKQISRWHNDVSTNFQYRFNWGLGALVALAIDEAYQGEQRSPSLEDWPKTQLPWIVFWLKELITWGTLDPVAAYLLSRKLEITRRSAETRAQEYYRIYASTDPNEVLNASRIRKWTESLNQRIGSKEGERWGHQFSVDLLRDFSNQSQLVWRVIPIEIDTHILWCDPAGFPLAKSSKPNTWTSQDFHGYDFFLDAFRRIVSSTPFM